MAFSALVWFMAVAKDSDERKLAKAIAGGLDKNSFNVNQLAKDLTTFNDNNAHRLNLTILDYMEAMAEFANDPDVSADKRTLGIMYAKMLNSYYNSI